MNFYVKINFFYRILLFIVVFTVVFIVIRVTQLVDVKILESNIIGLTALYSAIVLIFSIISAFIIQTEWNKWDMLVNSVKGEINGMRELLMFSRQFPPKIEEKIRHSIKHYLQHLIHEDWHNIESGIPTAELEHAVEDMEDIVFHITEDAPQLAQTSFAIFTNILNSRNNRIFYGSRHLPFLLNITITFATVILIVLSFLISVPNPYLDYIFTVSLALLVFLIYNVIEDLDHPYRPGTWHLTKDEYRKLCDEVK